MLPKIIWQKKLGIASRDLGRFFPMAKPLLCGCSGCRPFTGLPRPAGPGRGRRGPAGASSPLVTQRRAPGSLERPTAQNRIPRARPVAAARWGHKLLSGSVGPRDRTSPHPASGGEGGTEGEGGLEDLVRLLEELLGPGLEPRELLVRGFLLLGGARRRGALVRRRRAPVLRLVLPFLGL